MRVPAGGGTVRRGRAQSPHPSVVVARSWNPAARSIVIWPAHPKRGQTTPWASRLQVPKTAANPGDCEGRCRASSPTSARSPGFERRCLWEGTPPDPARRTRRSRAPPPQDPGHAEPRASSRRAGREEPRSRYRTRAGTATSSSAGRPVPIAGGDDPGSRRPTHPHPSDLGPCGATPRRGRTVRSPCRRGAVEPSARDPLLPSWGTSNTYLGVVAGGLPMPRFSRTPSRPPEWRDGSPPSCSRT